MKVKMKKLVMVLLCVSVWAMNFAAMGECTDKSIYEPIPETEDFTYEIMGKTSDNQYIEIMGLTQTGESKEVLVVPETIDGIPVTRLHKNTLFLGDIAIWETERLTALYLLCNPYVDTEFHCPNLKGVFMLTVSMEKRGFSIGNRVGKVFVSAIEYFTCYDNRPHIVFPANVSYCLNYNDSPNYGYYWLDNLNDGEKITYIPNEPTREGYKFGGWYHEPECITAGILRMTL